MDIVDPLTDPQVTAGYAIIVTLIDNIGQRTFMAGLTVWPDNAEGRYSRDTVYDALPTEKKRPKKRIEVPSTGSAPTHSTLRRPAGSRRR